MPYRLACPTCQTLYLIPEDSLGKKLQCKKCRQPFFAGNAQAPLPSEAKPTAADRPKPASIQPRPKAKTPPRRERITPRAASADSVPQLKKSSGWLIATLGGVLLFLGGVGAGIAVTLLYYRNQQEAIPVDQEGSSSTAKTSEQAGETKAAVLVPDKNSPKPVPPADVASSTAKVLPADLDLVPSKETVFLSVHPADLWNNPMLAPLRKLAETNEVIASGLARLKQGTGLDPGDIQRAVIVFWSKQDNPNSVVLVTTVKPFDRPRIIRMIGEGQREETINGKTVMSSPKSEFALHMLNERTFLYGRTAEVKRLLENPVRVPRNSLWDDILRSAPQHALLIGAQRDILSEDPKNQTPPPLKVLNPLLEAETATVGLDAGKDLRLTVRLTFARDEQVKAAEDAARQGLNLAATFLSQFAQQFKKKAPGKLEPPFDKLVSAAQEAEASLKQATLQVEGRFLECQLRMQSADWPEALAAGVFVLFPRSASKPGATPGPAPPPSGKKEAPKKAGGSRK